MIKNIMKRQVFFHIVEFYEVFFVFFLFCFVLFLRKRLLQFLCYLFMYENVQGKLSEAAVHRSSSKLVFLKISQYLQETPVLESLFYKAAGLKVCIFIKKEIPTQVFSCEYCEIFKSSFLMEHFLFIILFRNFM